MKTFPFKGKFDIRYKKEDLQIFVCLDDLDNILNMNIKHKLCPEEKTEMYDIYIKDNLFFLTAKDTIHIIFKYKSYQFFYDLLESIFNGVFSRSYERGDYILFLEKQINDIIDDLKDKNLNQIDELIYQIILKKFKEKLFYQINEQENI